MIGVLCALKQSHAICVQMSNYSVVKNVDGEVVGDVISLKEVNQNISEKSSTCINSFFFPGKQLLIICHVHHSSEEGGKNRNQK